MARKTLHLDFETYSSEDISASGAYRYTQSPDFEILLMAYAFDDEDVAIIDFAQGQTFPQRILSAFNDNAIELWAHNATFERLCLQAYGINIPAERWHCSAVKSAYCGLPFSLDQVSKILDIDNKKKETGKMLIRYFCVPCKPTAINKGRTRNLPEHAPDKWELFKEYCIGDVEAEREIEERLSDYKIPATERAIYGVDADINDRGVRIDMHMARTAVAVSEEFNERLINRVISITGLANPNSGAQLKAWLEQQTGQSVTSLTKETLPVLARQFKHNKKVAKVLEARSRLGKTSVAKYTAMLASAGEDDRARGLFQFYGANRTGRWAGRLIQLQNLPRNYIKNMHEPRALLCAGDGDALELMYGDVQDTLSQLIRTTFIPSEGNLLYVADYSAIEARVISWLSGEEWRLEVFRGDGKIYEATAARMFNVPVESIGKSSDLRSKGKVAELALGYQGAVSALERMGGAKMGLSEEEMASIVKRWRKANPSIVALWADLQECAIDAVRWKRKSVSKFRGLVFDCDDYAMTITLPSGRQLFYKSARLKPDRWGGSSVVYEGTNQETKQWGAVDTYGGKLTENVVQAIARDLLAYALVQLRKAGYPVVMHIHDEAVIDFPEQSPDEHLADICAIMALKPAWAEGLPQRAEGFYTKFYMKD